MITGCTEYSKLTAQQHVDFYKVFENFLKDIKPKRVLEIGTAGGGFIMAMRDILNSIGLEDTTIKTFEIHDRDWYIRLRENNIEVNLINLFDDTYMNLSKPELIESYIKDEGITLVLCDGGHKIGEFNSIAPLIKEGDFIMCHDYIDTWENFQNNFRNKIWDWCEVEEQYIEKVSREQNLVFYNQENFSKIVWCCKKKVSH